MRQLSIFDILGAKKVIVKYVDFKGAHHTDEIEYHSIEDLRKWREEHTDFYFIGIEVKK